MSPWRKKKKESLCRYDEVNDSEARRFPRLLNMDPQCITCILSSGKQWETLRGGGFEDVGLWDGSDAATNLRLQAATRGWQRQGRISPGPPGSVAPPTSWFWPRDAVDGFLAFTTVRQYTSAALRNHICDNLRQQPQEEANRSSLSPWLFGRAPSAAATSPFCSPWAWCAHPRSGSPCSWQGLHQKRNCCFKGSFPDDPPPRAPCVRSLPSSWSVSPAWLTTCQIWGAVSGFLTHDGRNFVYRLFSSWACYTVGAQ